MYDKLTYDHGVNLLACGLGTSLTYMAITSRGPRPSDIVITIIDEVPVAFSMYANKYKVFDCKCGCKKENQWRLNIT